jgi:hypothetical protein
MHRSGAHIFFLPCKCIEAGHKYFFSALHGVAHIFSCLSRSSDETPCCDNSVDSVGDQGTSESDSASNHSYPEADECIIASCGSTESSSVPESSSDEGDQRTTSQGAVYSLL